MINLRSKSSIRYTIIMLIISILSISVFATSADEVVSSIVDEPNITIDIEGADILSEEQFVRITNTVMAYHCDHEMPMMSSTYGLTCVLLGHDKQTNMVSVIEHKVLATNPRCLETKYLVTTCSRCDYESIEYVAEKYISCCD